MPRLLPALALFLAASTAFAQSANLLRNGDFQDDWLTQVPENKNHHWCYSSELYNRRDFNPDGWFCKGSWQWQNADAPAGQRRMLLEGPGAVVNQRVNWVLVHDAKVMGNMADAGGFPQVVAQRSLFPERLVRDLTFRVRLAGQDVASDAGVIEVSWFPPGGLALADPLGSLTAPTTSATLPLPQGTFAAQWLEVKLPAAQWLQAAKDAAAKNPKEAAGLVLPGTAGVAIRYKGAKGRIEVEQAELLATAPESPNLLANGGFEATPHGWSGPTKYRYFPGRLYYLFNTWHNAAFDNRGKVAADSLIAYKGNRSLQMIVPAGDELAMTSEPISLKQKEARLLEVTAMIKTDRLAVLHIDAVDENGDRLDAFPFIHMAPHSIGTNDWRMIRQVFRPRRPVQSVRLMLCARGVNGYTLDDTGQQPQNNVVGTIWWDDVQLREPESTSAELAGRAKIVAPDNAAVQGDRLDLGERLLGDNVLTAELVNRGAAARTLTLQWQFTSPSGKESDFKSVPQQVAANTHGTFRVPYVLSEVCPDAYTEYRGTLSLLDDKGKLMNSSEIWFGTWTVPIDIDLGALYLRPEQKQFVRLNLGLSQPLLKQLASVRLEVIRRGDGKTLRAQEVPMTAKTITALRDKLPAGLRDDFTNLLFTDWDMSFLPLQPFNNPERNWFLRVSACDAAGKVVGMADSQPFCRLAHEPPQPPVQSVTIDKDRLYVNKQPWMPWGVVYGHVPVYDGPADPGKYLDLHNLPAYSIYDRFTAAPYTRSQNDFNCLRYVAGSISDPKKLEEIWQKENLYCSSAFAIPNAAFSLEELLKRAGGKDKLDAYLAFCKTAPMVVSMAPGIEEAFGLFHSLTPEQLKGLEQVVDTVRKQTGKPVMISHGGYWNRLEFEKATFYDIFDPETEPLYPANLHTDLQPLVHGKDKVIWLRPQMYEDIPYERWRFHVYVELMRGCRGWQIAHGPGDASLFRGLHGEMEFMKPIIYSQEAAPKLTVQPELETVVRRHKGKTYILAASTRGVALGRFRPAVGPGDERGRISRVTAAPHLLLSETNSYGADQKVDTGPSIHGIQYLPHAKTWPAGTRLVQQVRVDGKERPDNLVVLVKSDGRWLHAASWGKFDPKKWADDPEKALWFLRSFYRHAYGFLGWGTNLVDKAKPYIPGATVQLGEVPAADQWQQLEVPLEKVGAKGLLDGVGFAHEGGRVYWGRTALITPDGVETLIWGDSIEHPPEQLAATKIEVLGLKAGVTIRVLFEDRQLQSAAGHFVDDFRGQDLYQRYGGGYGVGYGSGPVALHVYEIAE